MALVSRVAEQAELFVHSADTAVEAFGVGLAADTAEHWIAVPAATLGYLALEQIAVAPHVPAAQHTECGLERKYTPVQRRPKGETFQLSLIEKKVIP